MFVVPLDVAAVVDASCTKSLIARERRRTAELLEAAGIRSGDEFVGKACAATLAVLHEGEPLPGRSITPIVEELQQQVLLAEGKPYEARIPITNRILLQLSIEGHVVRTRPLGSWLSSQYRWTTTERWFAEPWPQLPVPAARTELVRRWLRTYGPGTTADLAWWTKWTKREVVAALGQLGAVSVTVETGTGAPAEPAWVLPDDVDDDPAGDDHTVSLLPSLDSAIMGWKQRDWYLGPHGARLFDRNGNAGPTIVVDGAVVGGWAQLAGGRVVTELLQPVDTAVRRGVVTAADELTAWFDGVRVTPRFPTPLQTHLASGSN
jgi:hypothetical protein